MARYRTRQTRYSEDNEDEAMNDYITVHEQDEWIDTGLLDKAGEPLFRSERIAMGYVKR